MSENFKKYMLRTHTYKPKEIFKHKHNYSIKYLLIVTNINVSTNYYLKKEYYYVLKCDQCNSFIPDIIAGNYQHHILNEKDVNFSFPTITANTMLKTPEYPFSKLIDVNVIK